MAPGSLLPSDSSFGSAALCPAAPGCERPRVPAAIPTGVRWGAPLTEQCVPGVSTLWCLRFLPQVLQSRCPEVPSLSSSRSVSREVLSVTLSPAGFPTAGLLLGVQRLGAQQKDASRGKSVPEPIGTSHKNEGCSPTGSWNLF